ncbi:hypothetical protein NL676_010871 [Syzygium grande]|nr:hypothetical protein NL676_010871 [Syzygium grande]
MATTSISTPESWIDPSPPLDPLLGNKEVHVDVSPEGAAVADQEGSSTGPKTEEYDLPITLFGDLLRPMGEKKTEDFKVKPTTVVNEEYRRLFIAAVRGYWIPVERELQGNFNLITAEVVTARDESYSMLDIAVMFAHDELVVELVKHLPPESDVDILRKALFNAARKGRIRIVRALHCAIVDKVHAEFDQKKKKVHAESETIERALHCATQYSPKQKEVISYLAQHTKSAPKFETMRCLIMAGHLDIALSLAERFNSSTLSKETEKLNLLGELAKMRSHFGGGTKLKFWEKCIYKCIPFCLVDTSNEDFKDTYTARAIKEFKKSLWNLATKSAPHIKSFGESHLRRRGSFHFAIEALL